MNILKKKNPCKKCPALCCKYITIELDEPKTKEDFENIRWYLSHEKTEVLVEEDGSWWIKFLTPCKKLNKQNQCDIYKTRPLPCREFSSKTCPFHDKTNKSLIIFKETEEIDSYVKSTLKKK